MITVCLDGVEQALNKHSDSWLIDQIKRRRADNKPICIRVHIRSPEINATLATSGCPGGKGGRRPKHHEQPIWDLWLAHNLSDDNFSPRQLVTFLKQLPSLC